MSYREEYFAAKESMRNAEDSVVRWRERFPR